MESEKLSKLLNRFLGELSVSIDIDIIREELEKHPDYPSMRAVSDVLTWFQVKHAAYHVDATEVTDVPTPFIAHSNKGNKFVLATNISSERITLTDNLQRNYRLCPCLNSIKYLRVLYFLPRRKNKVLSIRTHGGTCLLFP